MWARWKMNICSNSLASTTGSLKPVTGFLKAETYSPSWAEALLQLLRPRFTFMVFAQLSSGLDLKRGDFFVL
jgi:hypothetical protein